MTRRIFCKVLLVVVAIFGLLVLSGILSAQGRSEDAFERVRDVQARNTGWLMAIDGVEGTAIGLGQGAQPVMLVLLEHGGVPGIPQELDGVPIQVVVTGKFYALDPPPGKGPPEDKGPKKPKEGIDPTKRFKRPVPIGVSSGTERLITFGGDFFCTTGTLGARVTDGTNVYALSNAHVYALEGSAPDGEVQVGNNGDRILQPGRPDAKPQCAFRSRDVIGTLADFEPIDFTGNNTIDAAIALSSTADLDNATPSDGYGTPSSTIVGASIDQLVQKYGRTTSLTKGTITAINCMCDIDYDSGTARFVNQIIVGSGTRFIGGGDSGSLLVTDDAGLNPVGLLFAGTDDGLFAIANPIGAVLTRFGVTVDGTSP